MLVIYGPLILFLLLSLRCKLKHFFSINRNDNKKVTVDKKRVSTTMEMTDQTEHVNSNNNVCQTEESTSMDITVETDNVQRPKLQYSYKYEI